MREQVRFGLRALILAAGVAATGLTGFAIADDTAPGVPYWHVWVDDGGVTHQEQCTLKDFVKDQFSPPAPALWLDSIKGQPAAVRVVVLPVGWQGTWHQNPRMQWIVPLSGTWYVETMDGKRVEMGPGAVSFGEDQLARPDSRKRVGHLSGTVGDDPAVLMLVQMAGEPTREKPCRF